MSTKRLNKNMTYTFVKLEVSESTYNEVKEKLKESGKIQILNEEGVIDMNGIALIKKQ